MTARTLFRPVGLDEARLIIEADYRSYPPRLPEQPIFYPVLVEAYAEQIARDWNAPKEPNYAGFVTRFSIEAEYVDSFAEHTVGSSIHRELWVPAEELSEFCRHFKGRIEFCRAFYGPGYIGLVPLPTILKNCPVDQQLLKLKQAFEYSTFDFACEVSAQHALVQLNFSYWASVPPQKLGLLAEERAQMLERIASWWRTSRPDVHLMGVEGGR